MHNAQLTCMDCMLFIQKLLHKYNTIYTVIQVNLEKSQKNQTTCKIQK